MQLWLTLALFAIPTDPASIDAGKQIYMGSCSGCHGATGEGSQGPSLLSGRASRLPDRTLFNSIKNGLPGTSMPNFDLPADKVWQLAGFVRSLTAPAAANAPPGDAQNGRTLFYGGAKCSGCHMILGQGGALGPDLSNIGAERTVHQLRESITKPSARIAAGFNSAAATTAQGRVIQGVAKNHNNYSVQILDKAGKLHIIPRAELKSFAVKDDSLMPAVTENVADLLAFLARQTIRPYTAEAQ